MPDPNNDRVSIAWLNGMVLKEPKRLVSLSERVYRNQIEKAAEMIVQESRRISILLISGPSASSKTTTAGKLAARIREKGVGAVVISLDNFFLNRQDLPLLPNGSKDFESIHTIDMPTLDRCFCELLETNESDFPIFDFVIGKRSVKTQHIRISDDTILIIEGIHALNPRIVLGHDPSRFKMCIRDSGGSDWIFVGFRAVRGKE